MIVSPAPVRGCASRSDLLELVKASSARHLATRNLQIVTSGPGPMAGVVRAAALVVEELFSREQPAGTLACHAAPGAGVGHAEGLMSGAGHAGISTGSGWVSMEETV